MSVSSDRTIAISALQSHNLCDFIADITIVVVRHNVVACVQFTSKRPQTASPWTAVLPDGSFRSATLVRGLRYYPRAPPLSAHCGSTQALNISYKGERMSAGAAGFVDWRSIPDRVSLFGPFRCFVLASTVSRQAI